MKPLMQWALVLAGATLWTLSSLAGAQSGGVPPDDRSGHDFGGEAQSATARSDVEFFRKAASAGLAEVQLGQLALERAQDPAVKAFGRKMVQDHGATNARLQQLAQQKNVSLPARPDKDAVDALEKLKRREAGADFDQAFMKKMVEDHEETLDLFQDTARESRDGQVREFAGAALPALRQHLEMAQGLAQTQD